MSATEESSEAKRNVDDDEVPSIRSTSSSKVYSTSSSGPRGILKHSGTADRALRNTLQWDEVTIAEHDKDRGTRMTVDEPKTPFHHFDSNEELIDDDSAVSRGSLSESEYALPPAVMEDGACRQPLSKDQAEMGKVNADELYDKLEEYAGKTHDSSSSGHQMGWGCRSRSVHLSSDLLANDEAAERPPSQEALDRKRLFEEKRKAHYGGEFRTYLELKRSGTLKDDDDGDKPQ